MKLKINPDVERVISEYPELVQEKLLFLRSLILEVAEEEEGIEEVEETLKWGEPSYLVKHGSTIRIDWKRKKPNQYALYFKCTSKLVPTFKMLFHKSFIFEGNRAIVFEMEDEIPKEKLKQCILLALQYHKLKHLPLLGM